MAFLKVKGLNKSFGGIQAIVNLDFIVEQGELLGDHRPQWRRQDYPFQSALWVSQAWFRIDPVQRGGDIREKAL